MFEAEMARQEQIRAARQEQAARTSQVNINTLLGVRDAQVGAARASASAFEDAYRAETDALRRTAEARTTVIRNTVSGWRDLSAAGAATLANIDASKRLGSINRPPEAANSNVARRLRPDEITNLTYQGSDIAAQLGSGTPLGMIAMQQVPQIAQIFAGPGSASVKGAFGQAGEAVSNFVAKIGPAGLAFGGLTVAAGVGTAALLSYRNAQAETERALGGVGRASGVTLAQINALAEGQSRALGLSRSATRDLAVTFASTGRVGPDMLASTLAANRGFAGFLGVDQQEGATQLAGILSDVSRGTAELTDRYGLLSDAQAESIRRMEAQGDRLGAIRRVTELVRDSTRDLAQETSRWSRVGGFFSDLWSGAGSLADRALGGTGGGSDERIREVLRGRLQALQSPIGRAASSRGGDMESVNEQIAETKRLLEDVERRIARVGSLSQEIQRARLSAEIGGMVRSVFPEMVELQAAQDRVEKLRKAISDPIKWGLDQRQFMDATTAFERLSRITRGMADDIERFGSVSVAALNRSADFSLRTSTMNPVERSAAEINKEYADAVRVGGLDPGGISATFQRSMTSDPIERQRLLESMRTEEGLRRNRDVRLQALARSTEDSASRSSTLPDNIVRLIVGAESNGNDRARNPRSTATGAGQFIDDTWLSLFRQRFPERAAGMSREDILARRYDRTDSEAMTEAYARQNARALERARFPVNATNLYMGHHFGEGGMLDMLRADPSAMARDILGAGAARANPRTIGNLTVGQSIEAVRNSLAANDPGVRSLRDQTEQMRAQIGVAEQSVGAAARLQRVQDLLNQERSKGTDLGREFATAQDLIRASAERLTPEMQAQRRAILDAAGAYGRVAEAANDYRGRQTLMFERDQIGRTSIEASVFARARSQGYTNMESEGARSFMAQARENASLYETKAMLTDGVTSFVTDMRRGGDAVNSLSNAFGNAADRFLSKTVDSVISNGFDAFAKDGGGSGGIGGFIASMIGGGKAGGGYTGPGERYDLAGFVHRGEVVFSQDDIARHGGVAAVEALRLRGALRGYATGGVVDREAFTMPNARAMSSAGSDRPTVVFSPNIIPPVGYEARSRDVDDGQGGRRPEIFFEEMTARGIQSPRGQAALKQPRVAAR
ncbi:phage tail length tape measure family protein [Methylorubrum extorquens]|uniref:phage tail length tape measure family protein n=1 Tax=Methylorubrum extorquens TaxID=408 RepID=UPI001EE60080|nr:phage tail length tape measure family protein [Methylorubrum extorquens]MCG5247984.1 phage tail length tape measure family protein [Methylorubrum extorquens]